MCVCVSTDDSITLEFLQQHFRKCQSPHESGEKAPPPSFHHFRVATHLFHVYSKPQVSIELLTTVQGADIAVTDMDGKSALHWTANNSDPSSARVLLEMAPLSVNLRDNDGRTALHLAVVVGNRAIVETLVSCVGGL